MQSLKRVGIQGRIFFELHDNSEVVAIKDGYGKVLVNLFAVDSFRSSGEIHDVIKLLQECLDNHKRNRTK